MVKRSDKAIGCLQRSTGVSFVPVLIIYMWSVCQDKLASWAVLRVAIMRPSTEAKFARVKLSQPSVVEAHSTAPAVNCQSNLARSFRSQNDRCCGRYLKSRDDNKCSS